MPFRYFNEEPILKPEHLFRKVDNWPETAIITWQSGFVRAAQNYNIKPLSIKAKSNRILVSELTYKDKRYAFSQIGIGGPSTAPFIEEMAVFGTKNFVFIGSCGELTADLKGKIIVPDRAFRDEGTSWHYIPETEEYIDIQTAQHTESIVKSLGFGYEVGSIWTTDAVYRETPSAVKYYRDRGCIAVDMECASIMAVAKCKMLNAYQVLFTADSLAGGNWKKGRLLHMAKTAWDAYLNLALELADSVTEIS